MTLSSQSSGRRISSTALTLIVLLAESVRLIVETSIFTSLPMSATLSRPCRDNTENQSPRNGRNETGYVRPDRIFGHLHYAKTAGTEVNGQLAARYERICGHKGYSYDAFQYNKRQVAEAIALRRPLTETDGGPDIISLYDKDFNRGRVPGNVMHEIGFEDCDYISIEEPWQNWISHAKMWPVELHVPCREPLEHLMSQCNYVYHRFDCNASDLVQEVRSCFVQPNRFHAQLTGVANLTMKCFNAVPVEPYLAYMDKFLQRKRLAATYIHRATNNKRNRNTECIWKNQTFADALLAILLSHDYYGWCKQCIGSDNDLLKPL